MRANRLLFNKCKLITTRNYSKLTSKSKGEFDPYHSFPNDQHDEHVAPTSEDYVNELLDRDYYHYFRKDSDKIGNDPYEEQRIWYHWYINTSEFIEKYVWIGPFGKFILLTYPGILLFYIFKVLRRNSETSSYLQNRYIRI